MVWRFIANNIKRAECMVETRWFITEWFDGKLIEIVTNKLTVLNEFWNVFIEEVVILVDECLFDALEQLCVIHEINFLRSYTAALAHPGSSPRPTKKFESA